MKQINGFSHSNVQLPTIWIPLFNHLLKVEQFQLNLTKNSREETEDIENRQLVEEKQNNRKNIDVEFAGSSCKYSLWIESSKWREITVNIIQDIFLFPVRSLLIISG